MKILQSHEFKGNGISTITIGDPMYLEAIINNTASKGMKNLVFSHKVSKSMELNIKIQDSYDFMGETVDFTAVHANIYGLRHALPNVTKDRILETFKEGKYTPARTKEEKELGCDTARFIIDTNVGFEQFDTGGDGTYGHMIWYKDNDAFWLHLEFDGELFTMEDIVKSMEELFGKGKTIESTINHKENITEEQEEER